MRQFLITTFGYIMKKKNLIDFLSGETKLRFGGNLNQKFQNQYNEGKEKQTDQN